MSSSDNNGIGVLRGDGERILLVAEAPDVVEVLRPTLGLAGYEVDVASTGKAAVARLERTGYRLAVVDTALPDLKSIPRRRRGVGGTPVLFLATGDYLETILPEVGLSGEDYLAKPFQITDLLARVRLLLDGRGVGCSAPTLRHGDLVLDESKCRAWRGGRELDLTPSEYRLLGYLVASVGRVRSKDQIADHVWGESRGDNAIERLVSRLRRKVDREGPALILTQRGFGYALGDLRR
ncbi:response regulator transcription factor [Nocardiopsis tropica]|uniref:Response regulator transcription factor n=1 Tax=Nocardiopsis tropica TaxID=109330 RepID=A0ABU7KMF1_9ACTN|nr:response regulator transcription factor [Nocardiopsis umidischolae]MEE2050462.1 response regulator transcription factor [Nocardiopsis umidischolae]